MKPRSLLAPVLLAAALAVPATAQTLVGAWTYGDTLTPSSSGTGAFVFLPNGAYFHIESDNVDDAAHGQDGMERGTYTWDSGTGLFTLTSLAVNTNGEWGLSHGLGVGNSFTLDVAGNSANGGQLTRVTGGSALVGAWTYGDTLTPASTGTGVFVFLANGAYFHAESDNIDDAAHGQDGIERGSYTWNPGDNTFTLTSLSVNTNGEWGLSHGLGVGNSFALDVVGDSANGGQLSRVSAVPEPSTYAALAGLGALGLACWRRRRPAA